MFNSELYYEVWARKHNKNNKIQPLELVMTFKGRAWQYAMKLRKKLNKVCREVIVRENKITHVMKTISEKRGKSNG